MTIPARISASAAVAHGNRYEGELAIKLLPRLAPAVLDPTGRLQVALLASDATGFPRLSGRIRGDLMLNCRRCGRPFAWPLNADVDLRLVASDAEERSALHDGEPYRVEGDALPLRELVEEEVLLALPMLPRCPACENEVQQQDAGPVTPSPAPAAASAGRDNPFAALKGKLQK